MLARLQGRGKAASYGAGYIHYRNAHYQMKQFTENSEILGLLRRVKENGLDRKVCSDIIDSSGCQYVDLVQEGGGVLGIALAGYIFIMEKAGIRFFSLAGTSAGAISAMLMACAGTTGEPVSGRVLKMISEKDISGFVDGHPALKRLITRYIEGGRCFNFYLLLNAFRIYRVLRRDLGINPGNEFEKWVSTGLSEFGINTLEDLNRHRARVPLLFDRSRNNTPILRKAELKIITADITTKTKVVFPEMAGLYWKDPLSVNPALFVRASMSVPYFFQPMVVKNIPFGGEYEDSSLPREKTPWRKHAGYHGKIPSEVSFADGGLLSNFPINAFHLRNGVPKKPTFGVRLSTWRNEHSKVAGPGGKAGALIGTMRQLHDYDFLVRNPDYNRLICYVDADKDFNWLDFSMPVDRQVELFLAGARKAVDFLEKFDWEEYRELRRRMSGTVPS